MIAEREERKTWAFARLSRLAKPCGPVQVDSPVGCEGEETRSVLGAPVQLGGQGLRSCGFVLGEGRRHRGLRRRRDGPASAEVCRLAAPGRSTLVFWGKMDAFTALSVIVGVVNFIVECRKVLTHSAHVTSSSHRITDPFFLTTNYL